MRSPRKVLNAAGVTLESYGEGEHRSACPKCAVEKQRPRDDALAVLVDDNGATWLCHRCGWKGGDRPPSGAKAAPKVEKPHSEIALRLWREARPDPGIIKTYLHGRGITCPVPDHCVRYHPRCPRGKDERLPAMLALMVGIQTNAPQAIHRTFLKRDGSGKADGKAKMMLGPSAGACIKLAEDAEVTLGLGITEGIETGLSLMSIGWTSVWAVGDAGAIKSFPVLAGIEHLTVFADNDETGVESARTCIRRWREVRREAEIIYPGTHGDDWNDVVKGIAA